MTDTDKTTTRIPTPEEALLIDPLAELQERYSYDRVDETNIGDIGYKHGLLTGHGETTPGCRDCWLIDNALIALGLS